MSKSDRIPADLLPVVNAWPDLPEHLRAAILTLVNANQLMKRELRLNCASLK